MSSLSRTGPMALGRNTVIRVAAYYLALFTAAYFVGRALPPELIPAGFPATESFGFSDGGAQPAAGPPAAALPLMVGIAMVSALALVLPVAWIYGLTRQKRGYQQSVVQMLVLLPVVVAGIVVLVKYSLALAFALAGIVAAVRFRNTLEDSKDAVYVFLATAIGLASAVQPAVAAVVSVLFNVIVLAMWYTDFARAPAALEGKRGQRRIERALAQLRQTGSFVAQLDEQVFQELSPEQLELAADRAWRRRRRFSETPVSDDELETRDVLLRVRTSDPDASRSGVEAAFDEFLKKWRFGGVVHEDDGTHSLEYSVRLKKGRASEDLLAVLRERPQVITAELR